MLYKINTNLFLQHIAALSYDSTLLDGIHKSVYLKMCVCVFPCFCSRYAEQLSQQSSCNSSFSLSFASCVLLPLAL